MNGYPLPPHAHLNRKKYAAPPTWEQIESFMKETGMKMYHFEKFYGMPYNHLATVKGGRCFLSSPYWHIIYEKIKPAYGAGFIEDYTPGHYDNTRNTLKNGKKKQLYKNPQQKVSPVNAVEKNIHHRLDKLR